MLIEKRRGEGNLCLLLGYQCMYVLEEEQASTLSSCNVIKTVAAVRATVSYDMKVTYETYERVRKVRKQKWDA